MRQQTIKDLNIEMLPVPAGSFQRDEGKENISVITKPYSLSKYPITRQQFFDVMGEDPSDTRFSRGSMNEPVQMVNWYHAIAFCKKVSISEGLSPAYSVKKYGQELDWKNLVIDDIPDVPPGYDVNESELYYGDMDWNAATCDWESSGYRLPTEMEWMWAAMGADKDARDGAIDADGINRTGSRKPFSGSTGINSIDDYAWYDANSDGKTHPVGEKLPNELGLHDMSGNVNEWCWDWYKPYPTGTKTDHKGAGSGTYRVRCGGTWDNTAHSSPIANRFNGYSFIQSYYNGFRVLRPVQ